MAHGVVEAAVEILPESYSKIVGRVGVVLTEWAFFQKEISKTQDLYTRGELMAIQESLELDQSWQELKNRLNELEAMMEKDEEIRKKSEEFHYPTRYLE